MDRRSRVRMVAVLALAAAFLALPSAAEEGKKVGWTSTAELSYVQVSGNAEASTWGFADKNVRTWENASLTLKAGGLRAESTTFVRYNVGTVEDPIVREDKNTDLTGESYYAGAQYDRKITGRLFWNAFAGWDRNRFAGIDNRYQAGGGLTNVWRDEEKVKFRTDYAVTYTKREDVVDDPTRDDRYAGVRFSWDFQRKLGEATTLGNTLVLDDNVSDTSDWRGDMLNSISVAMTKRLALKASLRSVYYNRPAVELVPTDLDGDGVPPFEGDAVPAELEKLDTTFTTSLVINW